MIKPFSEREKSHGLSYGLSFSGYDIRLGEDAFLVQGYTTVVVSLEEFNIPYDIAAEIKDKSTLARMGIQVQNTFAECGWRGRLAIEITYSPVMDKKKINRFADSYDAIPCDFHQTKHLVAGTPIAQIIFYRLEELPERSYYGKYQNQSADDIGAKFGD
jgi:deoxycytidine triphosphate deaminase